MTRAGMWTTIVLAAVLTGTSAALTAQVHESVAARASQGAEAMQASRFDDAARIYAELVAVTPGDGGLQMNLGMARYMAGHPEEAVGPLRKAVQLAPALAPASLFLGASLLDLGKPEEAIGPLRKAVVAMPQNPDAREMLARAELMLSRFTNAAESYRVLTSLQPENPKGWYGVTKSYEGLGEEQLNALEKQAPDSPLLELLVADVAVTQDKLAAALGIYRRVLQRPPVGGLHAVVADLYERAGKHDWAAAERQKTDATALGRCTARPGECEFLAGRFREAIAAGTRSATPESRYWAIRAANRLATEAVAHLETLPPSIELHLILAEISQSHKQYPDAVKHIQDAVALAPGNPELESALAEALLRAHDLKPAITLLERLNRERPGDATLLLMLGDALLEDQQVDQAIPTLEQAVKSPGALPHAPASLGKAYVLAGRYGEALPFLQAAAGTDDTGDVHYQMARAYQALQRPDEALRAMAIYQQKKAADAPAPTEEASGETLTPP